MTVGGGGDVVRFLLVFGAVLGVTVCVFVVVGGVAFELERFPDSGALHLVCLSGGVH